MQNTVRLNKHQLDWFRARSRQTRNEIQAFLVGEVVSPNLTVISSIEYPPAYAVSTPHNVQCYAMDIEKIQQDAIKSGNRIVGMIHNHPEWDAVLSPSDYELMLYYGYRVCGIVSTQGRKTRPRFWVMDTALPCVVEYAKEKSKIKS